MNKKNSINKTSLALCTVFSVLSIMFFTSICVGQTEIESAEYETPSVLKAHEILPPGLLEGERFSVHEDVVTDGFTNYYTIMSPFGTFEVEGDAMLPIRIHEIQDHSCLTGYQKDRGIR